MAAFYLAPIISAVVIVGGIALLAMCISDRQFAEEAGGVYISLGGNPAAEAQMVLGEIRALRTALFAEKVFQNAGAKVFTTAEEAIIAEAKQIYNSAEFAQLRAAQQAGKTLRVTINGRIIQFQAGEKFCGLAIQEWNGFAIGEDAFYSEEELQKTMFHELLRLQPGGIVSAGSVAVGEGDKETKACYEFAEKASKKK